MTSARLYYLLTLFLWPVFWFLILRRRVLGKERAFRVRERRGLATKPRPAGSLIWFHGASVGETLSILPLAHCLLDQFPKAELLITSGTLASANLIEARLSARTQHQFLPFDHPFWVNRFLRTWRPDVGIWAESEIWPNLIRRCKALGIPLHLMNARLSNRSFASWQRRPRLARLLFGAFDSLIAQSSEDAKRFSKLGAIAPVNGGNIKFAGQILPASQTEVAAWRDAFFGRPVWLAASTHPGEEAIVLQVHEQLKALYPALVTIIAPRHLDRIPELQSSLLAEKTHTLYSEGPDVIAGHSLMIVDRMGVLGPIYQNCGIALVAGSLLPDIGGHNPIEPARNGAAVIVGQHMDNQLDLMDIFLRADALIQISKTQSLISAVDLLLSDAERRKELQAKGRALVNAQSNVLRIYSSAIQPKVAAALGEWKATYAAA